MTKLGQHFLHPPAGGKKIIDKIIDVAEIKPSDVVLEIGPGRGILTEALLENAGMVVAVEKDEELVKFLSQKFKNKKNLYLAHNDILKMDFSTYNLQATSYKLVANIPYYITGAILKKFLSSSPPAGGQPSLMVLMVQKEVAKRIVAKPPKMSMLSLSVQAYGNPKIISYVPRGHFSPQPKVDSAIIKISDISKDFFVGSVGSPTSHKINEEGFWGLVKKGFSHKRKMLKNNLSIDSDVLTKSGLSEKVRAQELSLEDWRKLYNQIYQSFDRLST